MAMTSTTDLRTERVLAGLVDQVLAAYLPAGTAHPHIPPAYREALRHDVEQAARIDLLEFARRDPACAGSVLVAGHGASGFRAVLGYRIAHHLHTVPFGDERNDASQDDTRDIRLAIARRVHESVKLDFKVDIHPGAQI